VNPIQESIVPGMIAQPISLETGRSIGKDIQWGAGQDSFYEVRSVWSKLTLVSYQSLHSMAELKDNIVSR
jgi:hypothetical protein